MNDLHLPPAEIERICLANLHAHENALYPNEGTRAMAEHWRECLKALHAYQEGRITRLQLPWDVRSMGEKMPEWGYRRD